MKPAAAEIAAAARTASEPSTSGRAFSRAVRTEGWGHVSEEDLMARRRSHARRGTGIDMLVSNTKLLTPTEEFALATKVQVCLSPHPHCRTPRRSQVPLRDATAHITNHADHVQKYVKLEAKQGELREKLGRDATMDEFAASLGTRNVQGLTEILRRGAEYKAAMVQANTRLVVSVARRMRNINRSVPIHVRPSSM